MIRNVAFVTALIVMSSGGVAAQPDSDAVPPEQQRFTVRGTDRDAAPSPDIRLTDALTFGGRFDVKYELEGNYNLDNDTDEQEMVLLPELTFSLSYEPFDDFELFANLALAREYAIDEPGPENRPLRLQLEELFVQFDDVLELAGGDVSFQVGRQRFDDAREWLFDERLDGVRAYYERDDFTLELAATRQNNRDLRNSSPQRPIDSYLIYGYQEFEDEEFELLGNDFEIKELLVGGYAMVRNDPNINGEDLTFLGMQLYGEFDRLQHWL
ncbi:MAG TPA: alginate export family protein, partial [Woeseiaceae bacterium]